MYASRFVSTIVCMVPAFTSLMSLNVMGRQGSIPIETVMNVMGGGLAFSALMFIFMPLPSEIGTRGHSTDGRTAPEDQGAG